MNPFQRARNEAMRVRSLLLGPKAEELVGAEELLRKIETELEIAIEPVPPDFHELGGGSAAVNAKQKYIYINEDIDEWGDYFCGLVAHELGHYHLDPVETRTTVAHLKNLSASTGSPGVLKVEAYGARERIELQVNVFARELLLPRNVARNAVNAGLGPRGIAEKYGIPLEFVRQQILDAVLLPQGDSPPSPPQILSLDQVAAATCTAKAANVVAGPGTGKTTTLIARVKHLIEDKKVAPSRILVVTFTNKAAFELVERLRSAGLASAAEVWAGTFHAFGLEFLRKYHQKFGLDADLNVADELAALSMLVGGLPRVRLNFFLRVEDPYVWLRPIIRSIHRLKEELVTPAEYRDFVQSNPEADEEIQLKRLDMAALYELHETLLMERRTVDFVDLIMKPAIALKADRAAYEELVGKFEHVLVDEYQDVTQAMVELVREIAHKKSIWVVGDVRQAINHWRGASLKSLLKFDSEFKAHADGTKIQRYALTNNRRSFDEVVSLTQQIGRDHVLEKMLPLDSVTAAKGVCGEKPQVVTCESRDHQFGAMLHNIKTLQGSGVPYGKQAVLCRRTIDVQQAAERLAAEGVPVIYVGDLAQRSEVKTILCLMQLLAERRPKALVGLLSTPGFAVPYPDIQHLLSAVDADPSLQRGRWIQEPPAGLSAEALIAIANIGQLLGAYKRSSNPWEFVCDLLLEKKFGLPSSSHLDVDSWVKRIALWQFAYSVRNGDGQRKEATLSRYLLRQRLRARIGDNQAQRDLPPEVAYLDGVRLVTVHSSKGLEYDAVHLGFVTAGHYGPEVPGWLQNDTDELLPPESLGSSVEEFQEEEAVERNNLLYVAVSRARRYLYLYQDAQYGSDNLAPQLRGESSLFDAIAYRGIDLPSLGASSPGGFPSPSSVSFSDFYGYQDCSLNYWYAHVAGFQVESEIDVSIRARRAVWAALREVARGTAAADGAVLQSIWTARRLPTKVDDPHLWEDVDHAYNDGLQWIQRMLADGGLFAEPTSELCGVTIDMPWGFAFESNRRYELCILRFARRSARQLVAFLRPLVSTLNASGEKRLILQYLLSNKSDEVLPSRRIEATNVFRTAGSFAAGDIVAKRGPQCGVCDFATICPTRPT